MRFICFDKTKKEALVINHLADDVAKILKIHITSNTLIRVDIHT